LRQRSPSICGRCSVAADDVVRSLTFATLVIGNIALILVNRSWRLSVWQTFRERRNPALTWILLGAAVLLVTILTVPGLRHAFSFGPLPPTGWLVAAAAGLLGVAWFEIYKAIGTSRPVRTVSGECRTAVR